ncbi:unnamed protein product [Durusdinium trenchii]|uniref:ATP-grasp domain-containing protein n=1 Tax=Durusdinium trenchii TaxID=1381693 RepID=A0ABP0N7W8_9DINO
MTGSSDGRVFAVFLRRHWRTQASSSVSNLPSFGFTSSTANAGRSFPGSYKQTAFFRRVPRGLQMNAGHVSSPLLIILPGGSGREAVLRRILATLDRPVAVLVPRRLQEASAWAKPLCSAWIECERLDPEEAWTAVSEWMARTRQRVAGCTTWDEWGIEICAYLCAAERLNLPYTPLATVRQVRNKVRFREACGKAGVPTPRFANAHTEDELLRVLEKDWSYPLILKPARGAGSYYCRKVEAKDELLEVFAAFDGQLRSEGKTPEEDVRGGWILEEWFSGWEVDVDGWAKDGQVEWMLVSDNKPLQSHACCEMGGVYPSQLPEHLQELLRELTRQVVRASPGLHSVFHFEALVNLETQEVMPVELNLRVGGAECPCCVEAVSGVFLPLMAARLAIPSVLDQSPVQALEAPQVQVAASTNEYAQHKGVVEACEGSEELYSDPSFLGAAFFATKGSSYEPLRGAMSCLAWLAAGGRDANEAEQNLQRCLSFCSLKVLPVSEPASEMT